MGEGQLNKRIIEQVEEIFQEIEANRAQIPLQAVEVLEVLRNSGYDWIKRQGSSFRNEIKAWLINLIVMDKVPKEKIKDRLLGAILALVYERNKGKQGGE